MRFRRRRKKPRTTDVIVESVLSIIFAPFQLAGGIIAIILGLAALAIIIGLGALIVGAILAVIAVL